MIRLLLIYVAFVFGALLPSFSQSYIYDKYPKEKEFIQKQVLKRFKRSKEYSRHHTYKTTIISWFWLPHLYRSELADNAYIQNLQPELYHKKCFGKKLGVFTAIVTDESDSLCYFYSISNIIPYKIYEISSKKELSRSKYGQITNKYDMTFVVNQDFYFWCVKDKKTFIYKSSTNEYINIYQFHETEWLQDYPEDKEIVLPKIKVQ